MSIKFWLSILIWSFISFYQHEFIIINNFCTDQQINNISAFLFLLDYLLLSLVPSLKFSSLFLKLLPCNSVCGIFKPFFKTTRSGVRAFCWEQENVKWVSTPLQKINPLQPSVGVLLREKKNSCNFVAFIARERHKYITDESLTTAKDVGWLFFLFGKLIPSTIFKVYLNFKRSFFVIKAKFYGICQLSRLFLLRFSSVARTIIN